MNFIDYDFIEIGTSDFDTLIQKSTDEVGISIEPIKYYLDRLPNKKNVKKIHCAVSFDDVYKDGQIYYIKDQNIISNGLPDWIRGCNSLNKYHYQHELLGIKELVDIENVKEIPISKILIDNNVRGIKKLKIDTEGGDCFILDNLKNHLQGLDKVYFPKNISFETNELSNIDSVNKTINDYINLGYIKSHFDGFNTYLKLL